MLKKAINRILSLVLISSFASSLFGSYLDYIFKDREPHINYIGQTGLIHLPSAEIHSAGSLNIAFSKGDLNKFASVVISPYDWFEASYYYHRPQDTFYIKPGSYIDKGFNFKVRKSFEKLDIAIGLDDIGGTGINSKEFIAGTYYGEFFKLTLGAGTGALAGDKTFKNPLGRLSKTFYQRPRTGCNDYKFCGVGEANFNSWFKGPIGLFGGVEIFIPKFNGLKVIIESNPYNYETFLAGGVKLESFKENRLKAKKFNYGLHMPVSKNFSISISSIKGNVIDINFITKFNLGEDRPKIQKQETKKISKNINPRIAFYEDILANLSKEDIYLQTANYMNGKNSINIVNNRFNNPIDVSYLAKEIVEELSEMHQLELKENEIIHSNSGIELGKVIFDNKVKESEGEEIKIYDTYKDSNNHEFKTIFKFPEIFNDLKPKLIHRYGDPKRFYAGGLDLQLESEIKFSQRLQLNAAISYQIYNQYKRLRYFPDSKYLYHVRTDAVQFLNQRKDLYLNTLQLDYIFSPRNNIYAKLSAGHFEMMFGGYGGEILWKPFDQMYYLGLDYYNVKQRSFKQDLSFQKYNVETGHLKLIYFFEPLEAFLNLSTGKYLAGDKGYTFDLSRQFKNGFRVGAYFTRTNISKLEYGEGAFDKGFYFQIPLSQIFRNGKMGAVNATIQPITRDGGAKLKVTNSLQEIMHSSMFYEYNYFIQD